MYNISSEAKALILQDSVIKRAYISIVPLSTEEPIIIDEMNRLQELNIEDFIYGNSLIGGTVAKRLTATFLNLNEEYILENREVDAYIGIEISAGNIEYIPYGRYIIGTSPKDKTVKSTTSIEALDYMVKFNIKYVDTLTYPCTLKDVLNSLCVQCGVTLGSTTIVNEDFSVENNQFTAGESCRDILMAISQMAGGSAHIGRDNKLYIIDLSNDSEETDVIDENQYFELEPNIQYGPINRVVIRNSQIEGENVSMQDDTSVTNNGVTELTISDNPFAYTQDKRTALLTAIYNIANGFTYRPFKFKYITRPYLDVMDKLTIKDMQGNNFSTYLFNHTVKYNGGLAGNMETTAITKAETKYLYEPEVVKALRRTEIIVNKAVGDITSLASVTDGITENVSVLTQTVEGLDLTVKNVGGNNLVKNSAMKNDTNFWLKNLVSVYKESDTPPENPTEGLYWYCTSNYDIYELGRMYKYTSSVWVLSVQTRKNLDNTANFMQYTTQYENDFSRKYTISNSMIKRDAGSNLDVSHIFNATNEIPLISGQEYVTMTTKVINSMELGVGYIVLGFLDRKIEDIFGMENEIIYSVYEPSFLFTPDDVKDLTEIVISVKVPTRNDFLAVITGTTSPVDTTKLWLDTTSGFGVLKEYVVDTWVRKLTIASCYDTTSRYIWTYRMLIDAWYQTPIIFDSFEIKSIYGAFTMYPRNIYSSTSNSSNSCKRNVLAKRK